MHQKRAGQRQETGLAWRLPLYAEFAKNFTARCVPEWGAMKVFDHAVFRRFWYPVMPLEQLADGPKRFELLGQGLALFMDGEGKPAALEDRCCHRSARLSLGSLCEGALACAYHGWRYDRTGQCVH